MFVGFVYTPVGNFCFNSTPIDGATNEEAVSSFQNAVYQGAVLTLESPNGKEQVIFPENVLSNSTIVFREIPDEEARSMGVVF